MRWVRLPAGDRVPLDPGPDRRGQVILLDGDRGYPLDPRFRHSEEVHLRRHWDHRSTCGLAPSRLHSPAPVVPPGPAQRRRLAGVGELRAALVAAAER